jgi:hypothetical protein
MELVRSFEEVTRPGQELRTLTTLSVALLFAAIYLFGGRATQRLGERGSRRFLSFAAGLSVSYTFVHILPALHSIRGYQAQSPTDYFPRVFPEYSVYIWAMAGFMIFYGLESMVPRRSPDAEHGSGGHGSAAPWQPWVHIGGFALYTWLLTYLMMRTGKGLVALGLFAVAMGMHIAPITNRLRSEYPAAYQHRGALLLGVASVAGWACGLTLDIPTLFVLDLVALVAGGVIVNTAIAELPKERNASYWSFLTGAAAYSALLLTLSHFEKGG